MSHYRNHDERIVTTPQYCAHIGAMTGEDLHSKADIAEELAWRDIQIERLTAQRAAGLSIAVLASHAAHKLLREDALLPHAEVEWLLRSLPKIDAWLKANGCVGISDFKLQAVDEAVAKAENHAR